jgi:hypothetical protein
MIISGTNVQPALDCYLRRLFSPFAHNSKVSVRKREEKKGREEKKKRERKGRERKERKERRERKRKKEKGRRGREKKKLRGLQGNIFISFMMFLV